MVKCTGSTEADQAPDDGLLDIARPAPPPSSERKSTELGPNLTRPYFQLYQV